VRRVRFGGCWFALDPWRFRESVGARNNPERVLDLGLGPMGSWGGVVEMGWWYDKARMVMWQEMMVYKHVCVHAGHAGTCKYIEIHKKRSFIGK